MNRRQRDSNRRTAERLRLLVRLIEMSTQVCEHCGEFGGHWLQTRPPSLEGLVRGINDEKGFWLCAKKKED